jgi:hypothetical protein
MAIRYSEIFEAFPPELRLPVSRLVDTLKEEFGVSKTDFTEFKGIVQELAEAQRRTEMRVEELAEAQKRTDFHVERLSRAVEELTHSQKVLAAQIGGLGARWGFQTEEAFRQGIRAILQEIGFTTERFWEYDTEGEVFGRPDQIELDVVVRDGKIIVIEIKSSLSKADTYSFERKVAFYAQKTGRQVDRKLIITPYVEGRTKDVADRLAQVSEIGDTNSI